MDFKSDCKTVRKQDTKVLFFYRLLFLVFIFVVQILGVTTDKVQEKVYKGNVSVLINTINLRS